ncbi:MAG: hypothetical protein AAF648_11485, partial [Pseudomonadota bacterium]
MRTRCRVNAALLGALVSTFGSPSYGQVAADQRAWTHLEPAKMSSSDVRYRLPGNRTGLALATRPELEHGCWLGNGSGMAIACTLGADADLDGTRSRVINDHPSYRQLILSRRDDQNARVYALTRVTQGPAPSPVAFSGAATRSGAQPGVQRNAAKNVPRDASKDAPRDAPRDAPGDAQRFETLSAASGNTINWQHIE